jgi:TetR/AcrR family transcriptional regulator, transcriptional repressor for nem operon
MVSTKVSGETRNKLLDAAVTLIRKQGFAATSIDQLCAAAGVTKGGFFHHFASKEALGIAAAEHWSAITAPVFEGAGYHQEPYGMGRLLGYLDLREAMIDGGTDAFTCLAGTLAQEVHQSHPNIARAAEASIYGHAQTLEADVEAALAEHGVTGVDAPSLALHFQVVLQGGFVLAKAQGDSEVARASVRHLKRYVTLLCKGEV